MLELLLIVLLLMLLRTATATLLLSFYYQPGTKHRSHTQTTNKNMKQPNSKTSGTSQLDTVQRTAFDTTLHQLQWLYHSTLFAAKNAHFIGFLAVGGLIRLPPRSTLQLRPCPRSPNCCTALMSWRERLYETVRRHDQFFASLFRSQVSKHRKRMEERDGA